MKEYDRIGQLWMPYLMFFHTPNYSSDTLNTDSKGFRVTYKDSAKIADFNCGDRLPVGLLVGSSSVFGVGATGDSTTIPSILNENSDCLWLNFGGRAFSSTQELQLFLFYYQQIKNIKHVVVLSGFNNLLLHYLSPQYSTQLGTFFLWSRYNQKMNTQPVSLKRRAIAFMLNSFFRTNKDFSGLSRKELVEYVFKGEKRAPLDNPRIETGHKSRKREDLLHVLKRDILIWKLLTDSLGIELYYVLQPLANWIHRKLAKEEETLFHELDNYPRNHWRVLRDDMGYEQYLWFLNNLKEICKSNNVNFFDINEAISRMKLDNAWLFVDRVHLTDKGNRIVAKILKEEVLLK